MDDAMRGLGRFVRERRDGLGLNQGDLGEAVGRDQKYISDIERGAVVNLPPVEVLRPLADALQCTVADLLVAAGYIEANEDDRYAALKDSADKYVIQRQLERVQSELDAALRLLRGNMDDNGIHVLRAP